MIGRTNAAYSTSGVSVIGSYINVVYPPNSTCVCTNGIFTLKATNPSGVTSFSIPSIGYWTVSCANGEDSNEKTILVYDNNIYNIELSYRVGIGYREVEYIQTDGTQWINSGIKHGANVKAIADLLVVSSSGDEDCHIFSAYHSGDDSFARFYIGRTSLGRCVGMQHGNRGGKGGSLDIGRRYTIEYSMNAGAGYIKVDGSNISLDGYSVNPNSDGCDGLNATIFGYTHSNGSIGMYGGARIKLYSLMIYKNDVLVGDFVPCYDISTGAGGLWNAVTKTFHGNGRSTPFIIGPGV